MPKEKSSVLLDTNILISGLVFTGNELRILELILEGNIDLVLPETAIIEAKEVLKRKFAGLNSLLDLFLDKIDFQLVRLVDILPRSVRDSEKVGDRNNVYIFSSAAIAKPDYVITGDRKLKLDLNSYPEIVNTTKACSSREFLRKYAGKV